MSRIASRIAPDRTRSGQGVRDLLVILAASRPAGFVVAWTPVPALVQGLPGGGRGVQFVQDLADTPAWTLDCTLSDPAWPARPIGP